MRLFLLFVTLGFSVLFMFYRPQGEVGFMFSDVVLHADTWVYFLFEHLILVILAMIIWELDPKYKMAALTFLLIQIVDTVDYCLTYGSPWIPPYLGWNSLKILIFGIVVIIEQWKLREGY